MLLHDSFLKASCTNRNAYIYESIVIFINPKIDSSFVSEQVANFIQIYFSCIRVFQCTIHLMPNSLFMWPAAT